MSAAIARSPIFLMPIFLGHGLVLVELMRSVQGRSINRRRIRKAVNQTLQVLFSTSPTHATGQGRKSDGECASPGDCTDRRLRAKVERSSSRLLRIYLMFDLSLPGVMHSYFCRINQSLSVTHAIGSGVTDHVWSSEEVVAILVDRR